MKVFIVISLLALMRGTVADCDSSSVIVRGRCYEKEVLVENVDNVRNLVVDFHTNVLYFSNETSDESRWSCYLDLNTKELGVISQVIYGCSHAVDQVRHEVYIAGRGGIYKFHYNNKTVEFLGHNSDVYPASMFYKDELYCNTWDEIYIFKNGEFSRVQDMEDIRAYEFVIDKDDYRFFGNRSGVFGKTKDSGTVDLYQEIEEGVWSMTTDANGNPFLCRRNRFFFINKAMKTLNTFGIMLDNCNTFTFDKDNNIIYYSRDKIVKLKMKTQG